MSLPRYDIVTFLNHTDRAPKSERIGNYGMFLPTTLVLFGVPRIEEIMQFPKFGNFEMIYGKSVCHPEDEFVRKTGVEMATKNAKIMLFEIKSLNIDIHRTIAHIRGPGVQLSLEYRVGRGPTLNISGAKCNHG